MARSGLNARNVRRERNTDNCLFSNRQASEICEVKHTISDAFIQPLYKGLYRKELNSSSSTH